MNQPMKVATKLFRSLRNSTVDLARFLARHWLVTMTVLGLYGTAWHFLYVNFSPSLPYTLVWVEQGRLPQRGEFIVYRCCAHSDGLTPPNLRFFKKVAGLAGDTITVLDRHVYVNQTDIGVAKEKASTGQALVPILPGTPTGAVSAPIPSGFYFAQGLTANSFDSRYRQSGLVAQSASLGVAHPIF